MKREEETFRIEYDDDGLTIIEKVNEALKSHGLSFETDDEPYDGFQPFKLIENRAAGPWVAVSEREPAHGVIVLARWADGAVRVVEWSPKAHEGTQQGPTERHVASIWVAYLGCAVGYHEWPTHWAQIREGS